MGIEKGCGECMIVERKVVSRRVEADGHKAVTGTGRLEFRGIEGEDIGVRRR